MTFASRAFAQTTAMVAAIADLKLTQQAISTPASLFEAGVENIKNWINDVSGLISGERQSDKRTP